MHHVRYHHHPTYCEIKLFKSYHRLIKITQAISRASIERFLFGASSRYTFFRVEEIAEEV